MSKSTNELRNLISQKDNDSINNTWLTLNKNLIINIFTNIEVVLTFK